LSFLIICVSQIDHDFRLPLRLRVACSVAARLPSLSPCASSPDMRCAGQGLHRQDVGARRPRSPQEAGEMAKIVMPTPRAA
jgi:hypothetical protein